MRWGVVAQVILDHAYYAPNMPPVTVRPANPVQFDKDGLLLRQQGAKVLIVAQEDNTDLPPNVTIDLDVQNMDVIALSKGSDWDAIPQVHFPMGVDTAVLGEGGTSSVGQPAGQRKLAQITCALDHGIVRHLTLHCEAVASHWAYHITGPGSADVIIEDTDGHIEFDRLDRVDLPDGTRADVIRTRAPLPARARPAQRFMLSRPGPFGPRVVIPVLPAPQPLFVTVPAPDGAEALIQSDIYVSIF